MTSYILVALGAILVFVAVVVAATPNFRKRRLYRVVESAPGVFSVERTNIFGCWCCVYDLFDMPVTFRDADSAVELALKCQQDDLHLQRVVKVVAPAPEQHPGPGMWM